MLEIHPVTRDRWSDMERLFEGSGRLRSCWCMLFRAGPDGRVPRAGSAERKQAMCGLVGEGTPVGLLGYADGEPVGWCSVAPRNTFRGLAVVGGQNDPVWSLTCFFVRGEMRRSGVAQALLGAAITEAARAGAKTLEAYPVAPDSPSYRFGGYVRLFEREGFGEVERLGSRRYVMRLELCGCSARQNNA